MISIANMASEHLERCAGVFVRVFKEEPWSENWARDDAHTRLRDILDSPKSLGLVSIDGDRLLGFVLGRCERYLSEDRFFLQEMCVNVGHQGQGLGRQLLRELHAELKRHGVTQVYLLTAGDSRTSRFYEQNGYRQARR